MTRKFPARLHVLLASKAPLGVVFRRGPANAVWTGTLVSRPFRVRVVAGPDFFDRAREGMAARSRQPAK